MSGWQDYITTNLVGSQHIAKALICGLDGTWWAGSDDFAPSAAEIKAIIDGFNDGGANLRSKGMFVQGNKYLLLRADDASIYGKFGQGGLAAAKCNTCVIISVYVEKMSPGNCNNATETLAEYLRDNSY